ncbi:hypothetical protein [Cohnella mopanensis]|uniref:hypothetical protein n=1 Tax=Cohnella mopanensis TaxID=2911966 RepID=UPI001EF891FA|nr:hypothetical protein [Cohnella mopanensis]
MEDALSISQDERIRETELRIQLILRLKNRKRLPHLMPDNAWHPGLDIRIDALSEAVLADGRPEGELSARAWKAALHLWNDSLIAAHELVQPMNTQTGAALHGIIHRREGDFDNAKYWFQVAGDHPAYHGLQIRVASFLRGQSIPRGPLMMAFSQIASQGSWNPYLFVNAVAIQQGYVNEEDSLGLLECLQQLELEAFIRFLEGRLAIQDWDAEEIDDL